MSFRIANEVEGIPEAEKQYVQQLFDYYAELLRLMPAEQRFDMYARAQMTLAHLARFSPADSAPPGLTVVETLR